MEQATHIYVKQSHNLSSFQKHLESILIFY